LDFIKRGQGSGSEVRKKVRIRVRGQGRRRGQSGVRGQGRRRGQGSGVRGQGRKVRLSSLSPQEGLTLIPSNASSSTREPPHGTGSLTPS